MLLIQLEPDVHPSQTMTPRVSVGIQQPLLNDAFIVKHLQGGVVGKPVSLVGWLCHYNRTKLE